VDKVLVYKPCAIVLRSGSHGEASILIDKRQLFRQSSFTFYTIDGEAFEESVQPNVV
jgi:hypothetical protein